MPGPGIFGGHQVKIEWSPRRIITNVIADLDARYLMFNNTGSVTVLTAIDMSGQGNSFGQDQSGSNRPAVTGSGWASGIPTCGHSAVPQYLSSSSGFATSVVGGTKNSYSYYTVGVTNHGDLGKGWIGFYNKGNKHTRTSNNTNPSKQFAVARIDDTNTSVGATSQAVADNGVKHIFEVLYSGGGAVSMYTSSVGKGHSPVISNVSSVGGTMTINVCWIGGVGDGVNGTPQPGGAFDGNWTRIIFFTDDKLSSSLELANIRSALRSMYGFGT